MFGEFTLDAAASPHNAKCKKFFTKEQDGLKQSWEGERVFCNPPFGREGPLFVRKAAEEYQKHNLYTPSVLILNVRTSPQWFHDLVPFASKVLLLKGRIPFIDPVSNRENPKFDNMVWIFDSFFMTGERIQLWDWKKDLEKYQNERKTLVSENNGDGSVKTRKRSSHLARLLDLS